MSGTIVAALLAALLVAYPTLHWAHLVLIAAGLSVLYAATVSLALPEQWDVVRYDVTLAAFWIALAVGTPTSIAGGLFILVADALAALAEAIWSRDSYIVVIAGSAATVTGLIVIGLGSLVAVDAGAQGFSIAGLLAIAALVLVHVGRRLDVAVVPLALDGLAAAAALGLSALIGLAVAVPLYQGITTAFGRAFTPAAANSDTWPPSRSRRSSWSSRARSSRSCRTSRRSLSGCAASSRSSTRCRPATRRSAP